MEYFELKVPEGNGRCSDDECPCAEPGTLIPRGTGYLYISQEVVDFRRDAHSIQETQRKVERMQQRLGVFIVAGAGVFAPILVCERGAKLRGLDLEVAAADAKYWWKTGLAPLRATPLAGTEETRRERERLRSEPGAKKWWKFWK